jgi:hypothetical protein
MRRKPQTTAKMLPGIFFDHRDPVTAGTSNGYSQPRQRIGREMSRPRRSFRSPPIPSFSDTGV